MRTLYSLQPEPPRPARAVAVAEDRPLYQHRLNLSPSQYDFITDTATKYLLFLGGVGSGKTFALAAFACANMMREAGTGTLGAILANSYQQIEQVVLPNLWSLFEAMGMESKIDYVYNERPPRSWGDWPTRFKKHTNILSVRDWGQAVVRSVENYDMLRGLEFGWVIGDEARDWSHEAFRVVVGRLRCKRASARLLRLASTPFGFNWIYDEFEELPAKNPRVAAERRTVRSSTYENRDNLPPDYIESLETSYDKIVSQQEIHARYVSMNKGVVYHAFDRTAHVSADAKPRPGVPWMVSFDFNRSPFSVIVCQPRDTLAGRGFDAVFEVSMENADTMDACREIAARIRAAESAEPEWRAFAPSPVEVYGDASGSQKSTKSNQSDYDIITRELGGVFGGRFRACWPTSNPPVIDRINAVNGMLRNTAGAIRLRVHPSCLHLVRDLERVTYIRGSTQIDKNTDKSLTHISDALGYLVHAVAPIRRLGATKIWA